ncbi:NERD domain-containing protein [Neobacillus notoginsengisoli]|uniref:NERD domain-containing protein n=1 Tax=Neobacillus notoginsengisoli TaxID=1578198 RepID=A0A417YVH8_9BACI|nr:nuclease-related domain-containing protein [Neobacillus notoginsengisoli]RHW41313.1 NERD domain-containing protein [Neobacillus notoginsengisoli]
MILKNRCESKELLILRALNNRTVLSQSEKNHLSNLERGYEGELILDEKCKNIEGERYIINDLLFQVNNSYFQIDSMIISRGVIYLLDAKNYQNDFIMKGDQFICVRSGQEYKNPIDQLKRCILLLNQLLHNYNLDYLVEGFVVFVNPEFTLYQASIDDPIILPTQINSFMRDLNKTPSQLNEAHRKLAQTILSLQQSTNPFAVLPNYNFEKTKKGLCCKTCNSFQLVKNYYDFICGNCGERETIQSVIIRHTEEFKLLFPERLVTSASIQDWCQTNLTKRTFTRNLKKHYKALGSTKDTYYE